MRINIFPKGGIFIYAACADLPFMSRLHVTEPRTGAPFHRPDIDLVAHANNPNRYKLSLRTVVSDRGNLQLVCLSNSVQFIICPSSNPTSFTSG
jgi:hypothetical protein